MGLQWDLFFDLPLKFHFTSICWHHLQIHFFFFSWSVMSYNRYKIILFKHISFIFLKSLVQTLFFNGFFFVVFSFSRCHSSCQRLLRCVDESWRTGEWKQKCQTDRWVKRRPLQVFSLSLGLEFHLWEGIFSLQRHVHLKIFESMRNFWRGTRPGAKTPGALALDNLKVCEKLLVGHKGQDQGQQRPWSAWGLCPLPHYGSFS